MHPSFVDPVDVRRMQFQSPGDGDGDDGGGCSGGCGVCGGGGGGAGATSIKLCLHNLAQLMSESVRDIIHLNLQDNKKKQKI